MSLKYSLVFLTLNEIDGLKAIYKKIPLNSVDEIFAVDGGSTDGTLEFYKKNKLRVINQKSKGRGEAFRIAMKAAKGDVVIFFSPDGNENPKDIPKFKTYFEKNNADIVIASRMMKGAVNEEDTEKFKWRKWANNTFNLAINLCFRRNGKYVTDSINGFRAIRKSSFEKLNPQSEGYTIEYEMTIKAFKNKMNIIEFPTIESPRIGGESYAKSIPTGIKFTKVFVNELFKSLLQSKHLLVLFFIILFAIFIRYQGTYWNIKDNPQFNYSIHVDEVAKLNNTLALSIEKDGMKTTKWLMIKGAGYPNLSKTIYDFTSNSPLQGLFDKVYEYNLDSTQGKYLFFRTLTASFSILLILITYKLANLIGTNKYTGILAAFFVSTIFGSLYSSIIFKSDIVMTTFITLVLLSLTKYLKTLSKKYLYLAGLFFGFSVATKYNAAFTGILFLIVLGIEFIKLKKINIKNYVFTFIISVISAFILSPYMFLDLQGLQAGLKTQQYYQTTRSNHFEEFGFQPFAIITHILQSSLGPVLSIIFLVSILYVVYQIIKHRNYLLLPPLVLFITYFALSSINTWIVVRYTIPFYPVISIFASIFLIKLIELIKDKKRLYKYSIYIVVGILISYHFIYFMAFSKFITNTTTTVQATNWINTNITKENPNILQLQLLGSEPPIVYGIDNEVFLFSGKELDTFIKNNNNLSDLIITEKIDYVVLDERSFRQYYRLKADKYKVYREFFESIMKSKDYELLKKIEITPEFMGIRIDEGFLPQDLILASPDILIYKTK